MGERCWCGRQQSGVKERGRKFRLGIVYIGHFPSSYDNSYSMPTAWITMMLSQSRIQKGARGTQHTNTWGIRGIQMTQKNKNTMPMPWGIRRESRQERDRETLPLELENLKNQHQHKRAHHDKKDVHFENQNKTKLKSKQKLNKQTNKNPNQEQETEKQYKKQKQ